MIKFTQSTILPCPERHQELYENLSEILQLKFNHHHTNRDIALAVGLFLFQALGKVPSITQIRLSRSISEIIFQSGTKILRAFQTTTGSISSLNV